MMRTLDAVFFDIAWSGRGQGKNGSDSTSLSRIMTVTESALTTMNIPASASKGADKAFEL